MNRQGCPWNARFSKELKEPAFAALEVIAGKEAAWALGKIGSPEALEALRATVATGA